MKTKYLIRLITLTFASLALTSCFKQFDPATYAPKFTINGYSSVSQIKPGNLIDYWAFNNSLIDSITNTSATNSGTSFGTGFIGAGLGLNVANKSYTIATPPAALKNLQSFTISFWVNPTFTDADGNGQIDGIIGFVNIANTTDFWGYLDWFIENGSTPSSATLKFHLRSGTKDTFIQKTGVDKLFGSWSNHTLVYDAATSMVTYYMNGSVLIPATSVPWTGAMNWSGIGPLVFGCTQFQTNPSLGTAGGNQPWASYLNGSMDEVRIYNTAFSAVEVNSLVVLQGKGKQ